MFMTVQFDFARQVFFLVLYGFLAWCSEAVYYAIKERRFVNRGLITLPIDFEIGAVFFNIAIVLPTLGRNYFGMYLLTLANLVIVRAVLCFFGGRLTKTSKWQNASFNGTWQSMLSNMLTAAVILVLYLLLQPVMILLAGLIPDRALTIVTIVACVLLLIDFITVLVAVKKGPVALEQRMEQSEADKLSDSIAGFVWGRLEKDYPGIHDERTRAGIVFAKGMGLDKLVWVFLISALAGDIIETLFCGIVNGKWMSRSSVVFGPFSFVWGIGAVLLTICLMRFKDKEDRWVLLVGGILGGAFEYMCSVFTEIVFGKVFWDYSHLPLNIGGRTNVLFMFFWGILSLVWVKIAYPHLSGFIEKFPPVAAKVTTWAIVALTAFNALFTVAVMLRYNTRQTRQQPANALEKLIDDSYGDDFVEHRWKNMVRTDKDGE